ncbi:MAG: hypothetical protein ACI4JJ_07060 [Huintestinicola sp.]
MKKLFKLLTSAAAAILMMTAVALMSAAASAEDFEFDVSTAKESTGWQQSFVHYTVLGDPSMKDNFNPTWMTEDSEVVVTYTTSGAYNNYPCELIWQTWGDLAEGVNGTWNKVKPYEFDDTTARFSYADIAASYGTTDFSTVYAICVGDTSNVLKVTGMTITNCDIVVVEETEEVTEAETEAEEEPAETTAATTEKVTEAKTEKAETTTAATLPVPQTEEDDEGGVNPTMIILIVVVAAVAAAIVVIIVLMIKKAKSRYY